MAQKRKVAQTEKAPSVSTKLLAQLHTAIETSFILEEMSTRDLVRAIADKAKAGPIMSALDRLQTTKDPLRGLVHEYCYGQYREITEPRLHMEFLMQASEQERKAVLGEALYQRVATQLGETALTRKIVGMLIELDTSDALAALEDGAVMQWRVNECRSVLDKHEGVSKPQGMSTPSMPCAAAAGAQGDAAAISNTRATPAVSILARTQGPAAAATARDDGAPSANTERVRVTQGQGDESLGQARRQREDARRSGAPSTPPSATYADAARRATTSRCFFPKEHVKRELGLLEARALPLLPTTRYSDEFLKQSPHWAWQTDVAYASLAAAIDWLPGHIRRLIFFAASTVLVDGVGQPMTFVFLHVDLNTKNLNPMKTSKFVSDEMRPSQGPRQNFTSKVYRVAGKPGAMQDLPRYSARMEARKDGKPRQLLTLDVPMSDERATVLSKRPGITMMPLETIMTTKAARQLATVKFDAGTPFERHFQVTQELVTRGFFCVTCNGVLRVLAPAQMRQTDVNELKAIQGVCLVKTDRRIPAPSKQAKVWTPDLLGPASVDAAPEEQEITAPEAMDRRIVFALRRGGYEDGVMESAVRGAFNDIIETVEVTESSERIIIIFKKGHGRAVEEGTVCGEVAHIGPPVM
jgi:hypothetical protein